MTEFRTGYLDAAINDLPGIVERAMDELKGVDFDTLVGTGFSGALVVPALAMWMDKDFLLVRKDHDDSHHSGRLVGNLGERWIFVDDFISSGTTLERVESRILREVAKRRLDNRRYGYPVWGDVPEGFTPRRIGNYLYTNDIPWKAES